VVSLVHGVRVTIEGTEGAGWNSLLRLARIRKEEADATLQFLVDDWSPLLPGLIPLELAEIVDQLIAAQ